MEHQMTFTIYPAIDLRNGQVVRLRQGDPNQQKEYSNDPVEIAKKWQSLFKKTFSCGMIFGPKKYKMV